MNGWLNWREIEKNNDWGVRDKDDATAQMWDKGAAGWEDRAVREEDFNRRQVEALALDKDDSVLDVCCGPGPLTRWIAPRVKAVTAFDFSENMLAYVKEKAQRYALNNVSYLQGKGARCGRAAVRRGGDPPFARAGRHSPVFPLGHKALLFALHGLSGRPSAA